MNAQIVTLTCPEQPSPTYTFAGQTYSVRCYKCTNVFVSLSAFHKCDDNVVLHDVCDQCFILTLISTNNWDLYIPSQNLTVHGIINWTRIDVDGGSSIYTFTKAP